MQRILRTQLQVATANNLRNFKIRADALQTADNLRPDKHWKSRRGTKTILAVLATLQQMAGRRQRCMYCVDSLGADIEHFWPKANYPDRMYVWENLLLNCTNCGRKKGNKFPVAKDGEPLLIDPSVEDPWDFLDFDPDTGNLSARYFVVPGEFSAKGEATVQMLHLDRREGVSQGYLKTYRRLCRLVERWVEGGVENDFLEQLYEVDDHGLLGWILHGSGSNEPMFVHFRVSHPSEWAACQQEFQ